MQAQFRNSTMDIFKLVACFLVISLHINYGQVNEIYVILIRLAGRWAVPLFFMISGYYYQKGLEKSPETALRKNVFKVICIILIANLVYLPFIMGDFKLNHFFSGDYFHLWYLNSLLLGFIAVYLIKKLKLPLILEMMLGVFCIFLWLISEPYSFLIGEYRQYVSFLLPYALISIPFMLMGGYFYSNVLVQKLLTVKTGFILLTFGLILQVFEAYIIYIVAHTDANSHPFLTGTSFLATGIFILGLTLKIKNDTLSAWGEKYSLFIYVYHPMLLFILNAYHYSDNFNTYLLVIMPVFIFFLTLIMGIILDKYFHPLFLILTGSIKEIFSKRQLSDSKI